MSWITEVIEGKHAHIGVLALRLVVGLAFVLHGIGKWSNIAGTSHFFTSLFGGLGPVLAYYVATVEVLGGLALIVGLGTRIAGLLMAVNMAVVVLYVKWSKGFVGGFELELTFLAASLFFIFHGPGKYSLEKVFKLKHAF